MSASTPPLNKKMQAPRASLRDFWALKPRGPCVAEDLFGSQGFSGASRALRASRAPRAMQSRGALRPLGFSVVKGPEPEGRAGVIMMGSGSQLDPHADLRARTHARTPTHARTHARARMHARTRARMHARARALTHARTHSRTHAPARPHARARARTHKGARTQASLHAGQNVGPDGILGRAGTEGLSSLECLLAQKAFYQLLVYQLRGRLPAPRFLRLPGPRSLK